MPTIRLTNRFSPDAHNKRDSARKLAEKTYSEDNTKPILPIDSESLPVLALSAHSVLIGHIQDGEFKEWIDKIGVRDLNIDILHPETSIIALIIRAASLYPAPEVLIDRIIQDLEYIKKRADSKMRGDTYQIQRRRYAGYMQSLQDHKRHQGQSDKPSENAARRGGSGVHGLRE